MHEICRAAQALPPVEGPPRTVDLLLEGVTLVITAGRAAAASALQESAEAVAALPPAEVLRWGRMAPGGLHHHLGSRRSAQERS